MTEMNFPNLKDMDTLIDNLEKEIKEKNDNGLELIQKFKSRIKENPDYMFNMDETLYDKLMDKIDTNKTTVIAMTKDIDKKIEKLEKIKLDINDYIKMNDTLASIINNQKIGSLLQHSVNASEKFIQDNKIKKIRKTIFPRLLKMSRFTIKESKKTIGGSLKRKTQKKKV
jgi:hypothetical protein